MSAAMSNPPHPGELVADALEALNVSARAFAVHIGVAPATVTRVMNGQAPVTPAMAVRLAKALPGPSTQTWLKMQAVHDAWRAERSIDVSAITPYACNLHV